MTAYGARTVTAPSTTDRQWRDRAGCRGRDPELWFSGDPLDVADARAVCSACPVLDACRAWAEQTGEEHGIWAGQDGPHGPRLHCGHRRVNLNADGGCTICARVQGEGRGDCLGCGARLIVEKAYYRRAPTDRGGVKALGGRGRCHGCLSRLRRTERGPDDA